MGLGKMDGLSGGRAPALHQQDLVFVVCRTVVVVFQTAALPAYPDVYKRQILGFGTVGSGVAEVIHKNGSHISEKVANQVAVKYILDIRDFPDSVFADKIIHDFSLIENDPEVDVVVETIGGATIALDYTCLLYTSRCV